ncbi:hypothetical protein [Ensifer sp. BR816]|uniref:hypothetical protein n=1 Tax=Rhizobium sp. (strain BR816) TaxID=1057002 RepID=UPI00036D5212|nr:hypothetical protein [Ensifer sp. BR816]
MVLDDEIASARTGRNEARWGFYLALAALAVCMVMIFGLVVETTAEAAPGEQEQHAAMLVSQPAAAAVLGGERQISVGATLLAAALTAGTTFVIGHRIAATSKARSRRHGR